MRPEVRAYDFLEKFNSILKLLLYLNSMGFYATRNVCVRFLDKLPKSTLSNLHAFIFLIEYIHSQIFNSLMAEKYIT